MSVKFQCGCILATDAHDKIIFEPEVEKVRLDCPKTWDLISDGNCTGIFQLESQLGHTFAKKLKPHDINELSDLIAILRPGALEAVMENGKSITENYILRKFGKEEEKVFHPALEEILRPTRQLLLYQEQNTKIVQKIGGFSLAESELFRKSIGKKSSSLMAEMKKLFFTKAREVNLMDEAQLEELFGWMEKSVRFQFNASHSISYAMLSYITAYTKCHFPLEFFTSYLTFAKEKPEPKTEIQRLVNNAKDMNIEVKPPCLEKMNKDFKIHEGSIIFGLQDVKGIGSTTVDKFPHLLVGDWKDWSWPTFICSFLLKINSIAAKALISSGALHFKMSRSRMLYEFGIMQELTEKELNYVLNSGCTTNNTLSDFLQFLLEGPVGKSGGIANKKRYDLILKLKQGLENPPYSMEDSNEWIANTEETLLGIALTCSKVDGCNTMQANCKVSEFRTYQGKPIIAAEIRNVREHKIKNGKSAGEFMAFLEICDDSGSLSSVVAFTNEYKENKHLLSLGNTVMIYGEKDKSGDSLIVKKVEQI